MIEGIHAQLELVVTADLEPDQGLPPETARLAKTVTLPVPPALEDRIVVLPGVVGRVVYRRMHCLPTDDPASFYVEARHAIRGSNSPTRAAEVMHQLRKEGWTLLQATRGMPGTSA